MAQYISKGDIFGRIGTSLGKGLSEQLPKEMERGRLSAGLKDFEENHQNLSPMQQLARLSSIPGVTPQMIQSFSELARNQNQGNAYRNAAGGNQSPGGQEGVQESQSGMQETREGQSENFQQRPISSQIGRQGQNMSPGAQGNNQQRTPNIGRNEDTPTVVPGNPLNKQNLSKNPWTPQHRNQVTADYIDMGFLPDQARQKQQEEEASDLATPAAYKERQNEIKAAKTEAKESLKSHLEKKLQKTGENVYSDIEGPMLVNAERGMIRDLIENPKADIDNVANDWSERLYRTALTKGKLNKLGQTTGIENVLPGKSDDTLKRIKDYQDVFKRSGNLEEFKNILAGPNFGMSETAASSLAFPPSPKINNFTSKYKSSARLASPLDYAPIKFQEASKAAIEIGKLGIGPDDSILSIMRHLTDRDPNFDSRAFLDQLSEDKDQIGLNTRQREELGEGIGNILPNWADLLYLPFNRR